MAGQNSSPPDDLVTPKQAARILGCCLKSVYRWCEQGRLRYWRLAGSRHRVSEADVRDLLEPGAAKARPPARAAAPARTAEREERTRRLLREAGLG